MSEQPEARFATREVEPGNGPAIRLGSLAHIRVIGKTSPRPGEPEYPSDWSVEGETWVWVGFIEEKDTFFFQLGNPPYPETSASLLGARGGATIEFESTDGVGRFDRKILASRGWYSPVQAGLPDIIRLGPGARWRIKILLVCDAKFMVRDLDLIDTSVYHYWSGVNRIRDTKARAAKAQMVRIEGPCSNGQYARFKYGPAFDPVRAKHFRPDWFYEWARERATDNVGVVLGKP